MGQAKQRGTFEERKEAAIFKAEEEHKEWVAQQAAREHLKREAEKKMPPEERKRKQRSRSVVPVMLGAALAATILKDHE